MLVYTVVTLAFGAAYNDSSAGQVARTHALNTSDSYWLCGTFGTYLECPEGQYATGRCGSGRNADCSNKMGCGGNIHHALLCGGKTTSEGGSSWKCGEWGDYLTCPDSPMTGACASGEHADCSYSKGCSGGTWHSIDCQYSAVKATSTCSWFSHNYGDYAVCPSLYPLLMGDCQSGKDHNCGGYTFAIYCCAQA